MANVDNPHGLGYLGRIGGGPPLIQQFGKVVGYNAKIAIGDAVNRVADGSIENAGTPGTTLYSGVALTPGAALTVTSHLVITDPQAIFEAQADNSLVAADLGLNANLLLTAPTGLTSLHEINSATEAVTASLDVHLVEILDVPDNVAGNYCRFVITFNAHRMANAVVGV